MCGSVMYAGGICPHCSLGKPKVERTAVDDLRDYLVDNSLLPKEQADLALSILSLSPLLEALRRERGTKGQREALDKLLFAWTVVRQELLLR